jgi:hypothetical protein
MMLQPSLLTSTSNRLLSFVMMTKDPEAYGNAYKVFLPSNALTLKNSSLRVLPLMIMIKYNKLYDPEAYVLVSILLKSFFYSIIPLALTLKKYRVLPLMMVITCTKLYNPGAYNSVSILHTMFFY